MCLDIICGRKGYGNMKKIIMLVLCAALVLSSFQGIMAYDDTVTYVRLDLKDKSPFGAFEGWGTSICWWGHNLGKQLEADELDTAVKSLFDYDTGLGLNIARFNIGGGDDPEHDHQRRDDGRDMPGFLDKDGNWDFSADQGQIDALVLAKKYGADIFEAFSNSPPYFMTKSGCSSGGEDPNVDNLDKENYDEFAAYLADVVLYLENTYDIGFSTLEPMNEPDTDFWIYGGWQEGCHFDAESHSDMIMAARRALDERGLQRIGIAAADETNIWRMSENIANVYTDEALETLTQINTHSYQVGSYESLRDAAIDAGKKLYMTEVDGDGATGENAGNMGPALWFSKKITDDLRGLEANAWIMWQPIAMAYPYSHRDTGYWNISQYDPETKSVERFKKYYAFMHYTKFIRPGDTLVKSNLNNVLSAVNEEEGKAVFVITNTTGKDRIYDVSTDNIGLKPTSVRAFVTDFERDFAELRGDTQMLVPANSIMTIVVEGEFSGGSIKMAEKDGAVCAKKGETLEFIVTDENGNEKDAVFTLSDGAPAEIEGNKVTATGEGSFTVYAQSGILFDKYDVYSFEDTSLVRIVGRGSGKALKIKGKKIFLTETDLYGSQMWQIEREGEYYLFKNERNGKYLSAENSLTTGEKSDYTLWKVEKDNGYYSIVNKATDKSLDVYGHATHEGAEVGLYDYNGGHNQLWYFDVRKPETKIEVDYAVTAKAVKGEPFGSESWIGNDEVTFDKAWDGNNDTFFDASAGTGGFTGVDLGEGHLPFNRIKAVPRVWFEYRLIGGQFMGSDEKDGEYDLIYEIREEDIVNERVYVELPEMINYRYIKYVSPEEGYCNISEIELIYEPYEPEISVSPDGIELNLGENALGGEKFIISEYMDQKLTEVKVFDEAEIKDALNSAYLTANDISLTVLGKDDSIVYVIFIKKY